MFAFLGPLIGSALGIGGATAAAGAGTSLLTGMASSMVMGGLKSLLSPGEAAPAAGAAMPGIRPSPGVPDTPTMDLSGVINKTPGLADAIYGLSTPPPAMAPSGGINSLPMPSTQVPPTMFGSSDPRGMMGGGMGSSASAIYGQSAPRFADGGLLDYLDVEGGGSIAPIDGGYAGGGGGRIGLSIPLLEGLLRAGMSGNASGYDFENQYGDGSGFDASFSGADIGYTTPGGASYGATYSQNPAMGGDVDREFMLNYSTPFANGGPTYGSLMMYDGGPTGGIMSAYPPGMDRGGMIRGPGSGVDDDIAGTIDHRQKVLLSDGEFVVPARVVSALGDGSSEAGAKVLHGMIDRVKSEAHEKLRTNGKSNLKKVLPA
jgi:hypothetical protein